MLLLLKTCRVSIKLTDESSSPNSIRSDVMHSNCDGDEPVCIYFISQFPPTRLITLCSAFFFFFFTAEIKFVHTVFSDNEMTEGTITGSPSKPLSECHQVLQKKNQTQKKKTQPILTSTSTSTSTRTLRQTDQVVGAHFRTIALFFAAIL